MNAYQQIENHQWQTKAGEQDNFRSPYTQSLFYAFVGGKR